MYCGDVLDVRDEPEVMGHLRVVGDAGERHRRVGQRQLDRVEGRADSESQGQHDVRGDEDQSGLAAARAAAARWCAPPQRFGPVIGRGRMRSLDRVARHLGLVLDGVLPLLQVRHDRLSGS